MEISSKTRRFLFYLEQDYSFAILRPLQEEARARGHEVRWLLVKKASPALLQRGETAVDAAAAMAFDPHVVIAPGERVPSFFPGLKVQIFHGLNEDKRGEPVPERGLFDLYCSEGPARTAGLLQLAENRDYFQVRETGWVKLDTILNHPPDEQTYDRPQVLYASTFTPRLSGAEALCSEIRRLSRSDRWQWLVTLHPKMAPSTVTKYREMSGPNLEFFGTERVTDLLHRAEVLVSDNSSILQEFLVLKKPVVTFKNRAPQPYMIDIQEPKDLRSAIESALEPDAGLLEAIASYGASVTPFLDGRSSARVIDAIEGMLDSEWQDKKPANLWRNLEMRRELKYYRFW